MSESTPHRFTDDPVLQLLDRERDALLAAIAQADPRFHHTRPEPERWSVAEIVEHVARVDTGVARLLQLRRSEAPSATGDQLAAAQLTPERVDQVRDRVVRRQAPDRVRPTGELTLEAALDHLTTARATLRATYLGIDPVVLDGVIHPHPVVGPITLRAWIQLTAHHDARHAAQIAELRA